MTLSDLSPSIIEHPLKFAILNFLGENNTKAVSFNELSDLCLIEYFSSDRIAFVIIIFELYNDDLLKKVESQIGTLFLITEKGRELVRHLYKEEQRPAKD